MQPRARGEQISADGPVAVDGSAGFEVYVVALIRQPFVEQLLEGGPCFAGVPLVFGLHQCEELRWCGFLPIAFPTIAKDVERICLAIGERGFDLCKALRLFDVISAAVRGPLAAFDLFDHQINGLGVPALSGEVDALIRFLVRLQPLEADDLGDGCRDGVAVA